MGGTILALRAQGHTVTICDLTNGEPTPIGSPERRIREATEAAALLGVERITLDLPNRYLVDSIENRTTVASIIRQVRPEVLFVPYWVDAHPDHVAAAALAEAARFYGKLTHTTMPGEPFYPRRVFHFLSSHYRLHIQPALVFDISDYFEVKMRAVGAYTSQFGPARGNEWIFDAIRAENHYFGTLVGAQYGEPFASRELVGLRGLDHLLI